MTRMSRVGMALVVLGGLVMSVVISLSHVRAAGEDVPTPESGAADSPTPAATVPSAGQNGREVAAPTNPSASPKGIGADPFGPSQAGGAVSERQKAIAEIQDLGGQVRGYEIGPGQPVTEVWLRGSKFTDGFLERLKVFANVQLLALVGTRVTAEGSMQLKGLGQLRTLIVEEPTVSNAFLDRLRGLPQLEDLRLNVTDLGNSHLEHLDGLVQLVSLDLKRTQVCDVGLSHLQGMTQLKKLDLSNTNVSGAGLKHLRGLTQLTRLMLTGTKTTDDGLEHLGGLARLQLLRLDKTAVTGTGLVHLLGSTQLKSLVLDGSKADAAAVRRFKRALPRVQIEPAILAWGWDMPAKDTDVRLTPTTKAILSALEGNTRLEFINTPLKQIVEFLADQHRIPIQFDEPRLRAAGVSAEMWVTRNMKGIALHIALQKILAEFGLTYVITDDALLITTAEEGQRLARQGTIGEEAVSRTFQKDCRLVQVLQDEVRLRFTAIPLPDAVDFLRMAYDIEIDIDRRALVAAGIRRDVRCTLDVNDVPLASALQKMLGDLGLTYVVDVGDDDEFITITAPKEGTPATKSGPRGAAETPPTPASRPVEGDGGPKRAATPASAPTDSGDESAAISEIKKLGGWVNRDDTTPGRPVMEIGLRGHLATDSALQHLKGFTQLERVQLVSARITDAGLKHLTGLTQLNNLSRIRIDASAVYCSARPT